MTRSNALCAASSLALLFAADGAHAQTASGPQASAGSAVTELVVTARRREEAVQDVPATVSVFTEEKLFDTGTTSVEDLRNMVPNFEFASDGAFRSRIAVRGLGSDRSGAQTNGVGFFIDGVYQAGTTRLNAPFFDLQRLEVLKGPQGARYGRNSFAGVINIVTRKPDDELRISGQGVLENAGGREYGGMISGPILPGQLFGKLSVSHVETDGDYKHNITGKHIAAQDSVFYGGRLIWRPVDNLEFDLNANRSDLNGPAYAFSIVDSLQDLKENFLLRDDNRAGTRLKEVSLRTTWTQPNFQVSNLFAYRDSEGDLFVDAEVTPLDGLLAIIYSDGEQYSNEVRVQSVGDGPLTWLFGGEYVKSNGGADFKTVFLVDADASLGFPPGFLASVGSPPGSFVQNSIATKDKNWALFGEVSYLFFDRLEATASVRYDDISKRARNIAGAGSTVGTFNDSALQPLFSLRYKIDDDTSVYATAARGIREGGFNSSALTRDYGIFKSDKVWSYEAGLKKTFEGGAYLNLAAFYMDASVYNQAAIIRTDGGSLANGALTLGGAEAYGLELDALVPLGYGLRLSLNAGVLDCTLKGIPPFASRSPDFQQVSPGVKNGNECQDSAAWSAFTALDGDWDLGGSGWRLFGRVSLSGKGETRLTSDAGVDPTPATPNIVSERIFRRDEEIREPLYLVGASIGIDNGKWKIIAFGENLTDELYATDHFSHEGLFDSGIVALGAGKFITTLGPRRRFGVRVRYDF
ncbi:TonB-dependent receptor [uncultured Phenylobacterium sp.]|uniref:TonB-dependent receptor n=1 Tax=uncultured Phenylobacterium sp. TaxID=349273 RepID=UPI0025F04B61|nr:TonB-dependent receptor [uncultured Phenylobacterium sp.]